jgi:hypothetical protein
VTRDTATVQAQSGLMIAVSGGIILCCGRLQFVRAC